MRKHASISMERDSRHRLTPWRSPYLLWRVETYCGVKMQRIGFLEFWEFYVAGARQSLALPEVDG